MKDIINNLKKSDTWKSQLTIAINFISSKDTDEERVVHLTSDNIKIKNYVKADEVIRELFESFLSRNQIGLETSIRSSNFILDCVNLLHYKFYRTNLKFSGSYKGSLDLIKKPNRKATIKHINDNDKCFQYVATVTLNHEVIGKHPQRL